MLTCEGCGRSDLARHEYRLISGRPHCNRCARPRLVEHAIEGWLEPDADFEGNSTAVIDLLADLRHYCDKHGVDLDDCLRVANDHHAEEVREYAAAGAPDNA